MNDKLRLAFYLSILFAVTFYFNQSLKSDLSNMVASVFFVDSISADEIIDKYEAAQRRRNSKKVEDVKIMIVPGHDEQNSGAVFKGIKESYLNLIVSKYLYNMLEQEGGIDVTLSRDVGGYNLDLFNFIEENEEEIISFKEEKRQIMNDLVDEGSVSRYSKVHHNFAKPEISKILYGINKYANDNDYDIIIHVHFNDYAGRKRGETKYSGFAIYIPEKQYSNSKASRALAEKVYDQLSLVFPESNLKNESGIVEDQELIAIGSNNTVDPASILIEYGYIYESQFHYEEIRDFVFYELASRTFTGIMNFLNDNNESYKGFSNINNYKWEENLDLGDRGLDVLALQNFLNINDYYPIDNNLSKCPITGFYGPCTKESLLQFQKDSNLEATGIFDEETRSLVNDFKVNRF